MTCRNYPLSISEKSAELDAGRLGSTHPILTCRVQPDQGRSPKCSTHSRLTGLR
jgi:hypothetical protein